MRRQLLGVTLLCVAPFSFAHDDTVGARFVQTDGANATDCLDHDVPCQSIQFALSQADSGNTVKAAAGIYDMTGVDPESFLFGEVIHGDYARVVADSGMDAVTQYELRKAVWS